MKTAIYPGSFDPVTLGHMDIIERAASLFDQLYIGILINRKKTPMLSLEQRIDVLEKAVSHIPNVKIISFEGLLADYCKQNQIDAVIRGVRGAMDFEYELSFVKDLRTKCPKCGWFCSVDDDKCMNCQADIKIKKDDSNYVMSKKICINKMKVNNTLTCIYTP